MSYHSIYVHIPFCVQRCQYCDFLSHTINSQKAYATQYASLLAKELALAGLGQEEAVQTVYFGGGTPTTLSAADLIEILTAIRRYLPVSSAAEITVETNPATVDETYLRQLTGAGFNRLSMGGQSFDDRELAEMGRIHRSRDIAATVKAAKQAGFTNIGVDLIYGLPGQSLATWRDNLEQALSLGIQHISLYSLQLDNSSPWGLRCQAGQLAEADEDASADMLELAIYKLEAGGFRQYEIANFALADSRRDYSSQHNQSYWQRFDYLGIGLGAASCQGKQRWQNTGSLEGYADALQNGKQPPREAETLTARQVLAEAVFLGLRRLCGLDLVLFQQCYGIDVEQHFAAGLKKLYGLQLLTIEETAGKRWLKLTRKGLFLANQVFMEFV